MVERLATRTKNRYVRAVPDCKEISAETAVDSPDKPQGGDARDRAPEPALGLDLERLERDELPARLFPLWRRVRVPRPEGDRAVWSPSGEQLGVAVVALEERDRGDGWVER